MFSKMKKCIIAVLSALLLVPAGLSAQSVKELFAPACDSIKNYLAPLAEVGGKIVVDKANTDDGSLNLTFKSSLAEYPLRDETVNDIYAIVRKFLPAKYSSYKKKIKISCGGVAIEDLKTNIYSADPSTARVKEHSKLVEQHHKKLSAPLVTDLSKPYELTSGLEGRHIAIWQSHGYYYEQKLKRWEWQRARIFETVEDLYTQSYVLPFLVPMLENAGANVLLPRERDWNCNEVIVDNDTPGSGYSETGAWSSTAVAGFANPSSCYVDGENPFMMGTARKTDSGKRSSAKNVPGTAKWIPNIPETGEYAVYVSYQTLSNSTDAAPYEVRHKGGVTSFKVNQQMGGGTWIYLGRFLFEKGRHSNQGVFLSNETGKTGNVVTADAVKFGGGMGNIARKPAEVDEEGKPIDVDFKVTPEISGYPRYTEGSRYWLQWAGFNDTIYSPNMGMTDYNDDYQSRGRWVNTLSDGSYLKPDKPGYNIPLDLSFAFHTDAGTTLNDSIVGTLAIYTRVSNGDEAYPHNEQRVIAREYTDIVQTQIVDDIRATYEPQWSRRGLWDKSYAESRAPEVPGMLLELLSHQNLADMRYGLDPSFRFTVSRAVYKGMLKFLAYINGTGYKVQPLPVNSFAATVEGSSALLQWRPTEDKLEPTATPTSYVLYVRVDDGGFDNGIVVKDTYAKVPVKPGHIYSFKVAALNEGGVSFPSEILSVGVADEKAKTVMVVNNFTRVSAPSSFASRDSTYGGFQDFIDGGVPYKVDISYIGAMHEYRRWIPWMDDDAPGFGASYGDHEAQWFAGNTFDYPYVHGLALMKAGYNFVSASRDAVMEGIVSLKSYKYVDMICGKQVTTQVGRVGANELKYTVFPAKMQSAIKGFTSSGGNLLVSGADIATDIWDQIYQFPIDSTMNANVVEPMKKFATDVLKYKWMTNYASATACVKAEQNPFGLPSTARYSFHNKPNHESYHVESPDALVPVGENAYTVFRYADNDISAGVAYKGKDYKVVSLGFPIETLTDQDQIDGIVASIMKFFEN